MTLPEAIALQPAWIGLWLNWMMVGAFILPALLLIWKETRLAAVLLLISGVLSAIGVGLLYESFGYVKLLGLPHVILWTPIALYLIHILRYRDIRNWPKGCLYLILGTILISLAFDYTDTVRYVLGEDTPLAMPVQS